MKFVKENKKSKEWRVMKILIDFENGMQLALKPENLSLSDAGPDKIAMVTKTDAAVIPLLGFSGSLATPEEFKARAEKAKAAAEAAAAAANAVPAAPQNEKDGNWRAPAGSDADAAALAKAAVELPAPGADAPAAQ